MNLKTIRRTLPGLSALLVACLAFAGCAPDGDADSEFSTVETSVVPGSYEAQGILWVANTLDQVTLDDDVRLDRRAATNIVNERNASGDFQTIEALDAVSYVGASALGRMLAYATSQGQVGNCGDGIINGAEACDGGEDCTAQCVVGEPVDDEPNDDNNPPDRASVHGIVEGSYLAVAILGEVNTLGLEALDDDVGLDVRAARAIVANQPIRSLTALDRLSYMGASAFGRLTDWVQDKGIVPFCGDGVVQPSVEVCDDGNQLGGDACPAHCGDGEDATAYLLAHEGVVQGSEIDSRFVHNDRFYMTARPVNDYRPNAAVQSVFERADGIIANLPADGFVNIPELARLSQPGFFESLLDDEQAALPKAWSLLEISHAPIIDHQYRGSEIDREYPFNVFVDRPGPLQVPVFPVSACSYNLCERVQRLPDCNQDDDISTVHYGDILCALEDFRPVFTPAEVRSLEGELRSFVYAATATDTGDFRIEFTEGVDDREATTNLNSFDGYSYNCSATSVLRYSGENPFGADFRRNCRLSMPTTGTVRFRSVSGYSTTPYYRDGVSLMEHWKGGERIYNRLVEVEYHSEWRIRKNRDYSPYRTARPFLDDGTQLELASASNPSESMKLRPSRGAVTLAGVPHATTLLEELEVGRYEAFQGVVVDLHGNGQLFAYYGDCEMPLYKTSSRTLSTDSCGDRSVSVEVYYDEITLTVHVARTNHSIRMDRDGDDELELDRTYIEF